ncbi:hypothetical protein HDU98_009601 [Podochytrium sp. JEL0797]|nr:hypothetical protein HDU98_009601 [Podochytrium sp. JEL0797]
MSPSYPHTTSQNRTTTSFPAFPLKSPLGKGFPVSKSPGGGGKQQPNATTRPGSASAKTPPANRSRVEEEYIRNLQQQVYLLELETRYLRTNKGDSGGNGSGGMSGASHMTSGDIHGGGGGGSHGSAPLNDAIKGLKMKYIELQENHKRELKKFEDQFEKMKTNEQILSLSLQSTQKEADELKDELKSIREHHTSEKDKLYGELLAHRKKSEIATNEHQRLSKTHQRIAMEKQQHQITMQHALEDAKKYRDQVEELLHINATLKVRVEELHKLNTNVQSKLDDHDANVLGDELQSERNRSQDLRKENEVLMVEMQQAVTRAKQEEHMKLRIAQDCEELVKANEFESREKKLQKRQDHFKEQDELKEEFNRLKDEYSMLKISVDNKDRRVQDLRAQVNSMENALNTALETRNILEERCEELESRAKSQETELIQIGQDKSLLIDDVAELRNTTEIKTNKLQHLIEENRDMKVQIEKFKRESYARQEFQHLIGEIESKGENYLHLMRNMKSYLNRPKDRERGASNEVDDILSD